ncbi:transducin/WD40 repeat family protein [Tanacetum coccineum]
MNHSLSLFTLIGPSYATSYVDTFFALDILSYTTNILFLKPRSDCRKSSSNSFLVLLLLPIPRAIGASYSIDIPTIGDFCCAELLLKGSILDDVGFRQYAILSIKGSAAPRLLLLHSGSPPPSSYFLVCNLPRCTLSLVDTRGFQNSVRIDMCYNRMGEVRLGGWGKGVWAPDTNDNTPAKWLVSIGNLEAAVSLMLSTPPESPYLYPNALRAVALLSAVSRSLNELAVKVVAANMVETDRSLSGTHLLCAVGRYQEACSQMLIGVSKLYKSWAMSRRPSRVEVVGQLAGYKMQDAGQMLIPAPTPLLY